MVCLPASGARQDRETSPLPAERGHQQSEEKQQEDQAADRRARHGGDPIRISEQKSLKEWATRSRPVHSRRVKEKLGYMQWRGIMA